MAAKSTILTSITPDEQYVWTIQQIVKEIPGFVLLGPGWYIKNGTSMLISGTDLADVYALQIFYDRDPRTNLLAVATAPVRLADQAVLPVKKSNNWKYFLFIMVGILIIIPFDLFMFRKFGVVGFVIMCVFAYAYGSLGRYFLKDKQS